MPLRQTMPDDAALRNDRLASKSDNVPDYELSEKTSQLLSESSKHNPEVIHLPRRPSSVFEVFYKITNILRATISEYLKICWNFLLYFDLREISEMEEENFANDCREADEALDVSRTRITEHDQWMSAYERERSLYEMACSWTQQTKENKLEDSKRKKIADPEYFSKKSLGFKRGKAFQKLTEKNKKNNYLRSEEGDSNYRIRSVVSRRRAERRARAATRALDRCMAEYLAHGSPELDAAAAAAASTTASTNNSNSNLPLRSKKRDKHKSFQKEQQNRLRRGTRPFCHQPLLSSANMMSPGALYYNPLDFSLDKPLLIPCRIHPWQLNINESVEDSPAFTAKTFCMPSFGEAELPLGTNLPSCQFHTISE